MWGHALYVSGGPRSHGRISWTIPCLPYKSLRWSYLVQHSLTVASTQNQHTVYQNPPPPLLLFNPILPLFSRASFPLYPPGLTLPG
jgi:hypothetical protein